MLRPGVDAELRAELARGWPRWGEGVISPRQQRARLARALGIVDDYDDPPLPYDGREGAALADIRRQRLDAA